MSAALPDPARTGDPTRSATGLTLSVVIPCLNAALTLGATLASLGVVSECIVVDGGSHDTTSEIAAQAGALVLFAARGRGTQLRAGVAAASHPWILLLHADTRLAANWQVAAQAHMADATRAGWFRFRLDSPARQARRLERIVSWRSRVLGLPFGDQGLLIHRHLLAEVGGISAIPLMEDVDLVRRIGRPRLRGLDADAVTSALKWETGGWWKRSARNQACLAMYFAGMPPHRLVRFYR